MSKIYIIVEFVKTSHGTRGKLIGNLPGCYSTWYEAERRVDILRVNEPDLQFSIETHEILA